MGVWACDPGKGGLVESGGTGRLVIAWAACDVAAPGETTGYGEWGEGSSCHCWKLG